MLSDQKLKIFQVLLQDASVDEIAKMELLLKESLLSKNALPQSSSGVKKITILFGTETGNSKKLATDFAAKAKKNGIIAKVVGTDQYRLTDLVKEEFLFIIISTHGEGDPPDAAKKFYDFIHQSDLKFTKLNYGVLALGDTSYPLFCKTGEDVDIQFEKLGGNRVIPIQKCDVEYEEDSNKWFDAAFQYLLGHTVKETINHAFQPSKKPAGKQTLTGKVLTNIILNDRGSNKETHHIEFEAEGIEYQCGDSLGIVPQNPESVVSEIITLSKVDGNKKLLFKNEEISILDLLTNKINIIHLTERMVKLYGETFGVEIPAGRMDLLDLIKKFPVTDITKFEELLTKLNAISPRLYTIASSPSAHEGEVHMVVIKDTFTVNGEVRYGLCSDYLSRLQVNTNQTFFVQVNKRFRLPSPEKAMIMIGPGTGIAPFRSFLAEREITGATGKNWLFFGDQYFATDFLYQTEIQNWYESGVLNKVNVAFSRDQEEKVYVQHKMLEHGEAMFDWISSGAHVYLCGKKHPMSEDVEKALLAIFEQFGRMTVDEAKHYLSVMKEEGRFEKDVY
jgi:sulfite reductase (NADPH) flavoprotein alpha-component